jgi:anti-sigma B factor antagonist
MKSPARDLGEGQEKAMAAQMEISHREDEHGVVVISLVGRIMIGEESAKIESLVEELLAAGKKSIVFDLSGVKHMDSTGIGRFIACLNRVMAANGKMRMAAATNVVREGFRVTRLDTVFEFVDDLDSACQSLS